MSHEPGRRRVGAGRGGSQRGGSAAGTPGKRALTDGMSPAVARAYEERTRALERQYQRDIYDRLRPPELSIEEHRATIDIDSAGDTVGDDTLEMGRRLPRRGPKEAPTGDDTYAPDWSDDASGLLTDAAASRAARRNPRQQDRLGFHPTLFSVHPIDTEAFAVDVAEFQASQGLTVDGIVGPATLRAAGVAIDDGGGRIDFGAAADREVEP